MRLSGASRLDRTGGPHGRTGPSRLVGSIGVARLGGRLRRGWLGAWGKPCTMAPSGMEAIRSSSNNHDCRRSLHVGDLLAGPWRAHGGQSHVHFDAADRGVRWHSSNGAVVRLHPLGSASNSVNVRNGSIVAAMGGKQTLREWRVWMGNGHTTAAWPPELGSASASAIRDQVAARKSTYNLSRQAITSSSPRTASSIGMTGRA